MEVCQVKKVVLLGAGASAVAAGLVLGTGVANASQSVVGQKFSAASSTLKSAGYTVVAASSFGDKLAQSDCLVVGQRDAKKSVTNSLATKSKTVYLSLDCSKVPAPATSAGSAPSGG
jgi:aspartate oxidase